MPAPFHFRSSGWQQVPDDQRHQHQLDLAQVQRALHRLEPQRAGRQGEQRGDAGPAAPAERAQRQPHGGGQRGQAGHGHQPAQHGPGQQRAGREHQRGERRVGELDPGVQLPGVQLRRQGPGDQAGVVVDVEVVPVERQAGRCAAMPATKAASEERAGRGRRRQGPAARPGRRSCPAGPGEPRAGKYHRASLLVPAALSPGVTLPTVLPPQGQAPVRVRPAPRPRMVSTGPPPGPAPRSLAPRSLTPRGSGPRPRSRARRGILPPRAYWVSRTGGSSLLMPRLGQGGLAARAAAW